MSAETAKPLELQSDLIQNRNKREEELHRLHVDEIKRRIKFLEEENERKK